MLPGRARDRLAIETRQVANLQMLELDHMIEQGILALIRAHDQREITVAAGNGGLRVHDLGDVIEQGDQERGLDHQLV